MPGPFTRILIVAAVSILALVGLVARESIERRDGAEVILRMEAIDPRALLTGHYVSLSFREPLPTGVACPPGTERPPPEGAPTWVGLVARADHHASVVAVAATRQGALSRAPLAVRGVATCQPPVTAAEGEPLRPGVVDLDVGVDRFHVSQAEAERIDALLMNRRPGQESPVGAIVSIGADGRARLKGLVVEGRRLELSWL